MSIGMGVVIFIVGGIIGHMICMTSWVKELCREANDIQMEIDRIKAQLKEGEDEN